MAERASPKGGGCSGKKRDRRQRSSPRKQATSARRGPGKEGGGREAEVGNET